MKKTILNLCVNFLTKLVIVAYGTLAIGGLTYFFYRIIADNLF